MLDFLEFILNSDLQLQNFVSIVRVLDLLADFGGIGVEGGLEQGLGVVHLVRVHIRVELSQLVVAVGGVTVVLDLEVGEAQQ